MMNNERVKTIFPIPMTGSRKLCNIMFYGFNECDKTIEYDKLTEGRVS